MLLELDGWNFAVDSIETVGPVSRTTPYPETWGFTLRTRSGHEHHHRSGSEKDAKKAHKRASEHLRQA